MCRGFMSCIIVFVEIIYLIFSLALASAGGIILWNPPIREKIINILVAQLRSAAGQMPEGDIEATAARLIELLSPAALALFVIGITLAVVSIIAFIGVCCHVKCMLALYAAICGLFVVGLLVIIIIYFTNKSIVLNPIHKMIEQTQMNYESLRSSNPDSKIAAVIMQAGQCCGFENGHDFDKPEYKFKKIDYVNGVEMRVDFPVPCCKQQNTTPSTCPTNFDPQNSNINHGCKDSMDKMILPMLDYFFYGLIGALVINLILFAFAVGVLVMRKDD